MGACCQETPHQSSGNRGCDFCKQDGRARQRMGEPGSASFDSLTLVTLNQTVSLDGQQGHTGSASDLRQRRSPGLGKHSLLVELAGHLSYPCWSCIICSLPVAEHRRWLPWRYVRRAHRMGFGDQLSSQIPLHRPHHGPLHHPPQLRRLQHLHIRPEAGMSPTSSRSSAYCTSSTKEPSGSMWLRCCACQTSRLTQRARSGEKRSRAQALGRPRKMP